MSKKIEVKLDGLSVGGEVVGVIVAAPEQSLIGMRGFVRFAIPGERITVGNFQAKKGFFRAELEDVIDPSSERQQPECEYFTDCGGCDLQHIKYPAQLVYKKQMLVNALRAGRVSDSAQEKVSDVVLSKPFGYRKRVTLHIDEEGRVGFYKRGTRTVISVNSCVVTDSRISNLIGKLSAPAGAAATMYLEVDSEKAYCVVRYPFDVSTKIITELEKNLSGLLDGGRVFSRRKIVHTFGAPPVSAGSFSQINPEINQQLIKEVLESAKRINPKNIEDLYSGSGNFAFPVAAELGCQVIAVESDLSLCQAGREKGDKRVTFCNQTVEQYLKSREKTALDLVIADPPRSGLGPLAHKFHYTSHLILISCHLPSCVRDLKKLEELGWKVDKITPFDMFPQTSYLEVMTVLSR